MCSLPDIRWFEIRSPSTKLSYHIIVTFSENSSLHSFFKKYLLQVQMSLLWVVYLDITGTTGNCILAVDRKLKRALSFWGMSKNSSWTLSLGFPSWLHGEDCRSVALIHNTEAIAIVFILDKRYISKTDSGVFSRLSCWAQCLVFSF